MKIGIVGGGVFGTSAAYALAKRDHDVYLFERETPLFEDAASFDISKAIRFEYGAMTTDYLPFVEQAFSLWNELEKDAGEHVLHQTGMLFLSESDDDDSFEMQSHLRLKETPYANSLLSPKEGEKRWPQFSWSTVKVAVHNALGGWLEATEAVGLLRRGAVKNGARVMCENIAEVTEDGGAVQVQSNNAHYTFDHVVVAAGSWIRELLPQVSAHCEVTRQQICFFKPEAPALFSSPHFPVWAYDIENRGWYGFPLHHSGLLKMASHRKTDPVHTKRDPHCDPTFFAESKTFVAGAIPPLKGQVPHSGRVCWYTNSPFGHPVVDFLPGTARVIIAGFGSGHAFKFGPFWGECVASLLKAENTPKLFHFDYKGNTAI